MADRLAELRRQRALVSEHLAWLDREIAQLEQRTQRQEVPPPTSTSTTAPLVVPADQMRVGASDVESGALLPPPLIEPLPPEVNQSSGVPAAAAVPLADPDALLEEFRVPSVAVKNDVRKGCLLYFIGAFVVLGIVIAILYFTISSR